MWQRRLSSVVCGLMPRLALVCLVFTGLGAVCAVPAATDSYSLTPKRRGLDVQSLLIQAEQGDKRAAFLLGSRYAMGQETARDDSEALRWFTQSAQAGLAEAQYNLGIMYAQGRGVQRDIKQAVSWYTRAAQQGLAIAQFNLGTLYSTGYGVTRDEAKAAQWLERAANKGIAQAQYNLAILYEYGRGVRLNAAEALYWYRKAEEEYGYAPAAARRRRLEALLEAPGDVQAAASPQQPDSEAGSHFEPETETQRVASAIPSSENPASTEPTAPVPVKSDPPTATASSGDGWFQRLNAEHYTLQLASYVDPEAAEQFLLKLQVGGSSAIYASTKQGKRWFSVIYGEYTSYQQAQTATRSLPASMRGIKPWVRKVSLIKKEMD